MGTHPIFESDFDCLTEKMAEAPVKKDELLDGISDIVIEEQNIKQGKMYNSILTSAQSAAVHEMNQKKAANDDIIKAVSGKAVTYPFMFFGMFMTFRALAKGLSSCVKGEAAQTQHKWMLHRLRWQTMAALSALGGTAYHKWDDLSEEEKQHTFDVLMFRD